MKGVNFNEKVFNININSFDLVKKPDLIQVAMKYYLYNYILSLAFINKNFVTINYILNQGKIL